MPGRWVTVKGHAVFIEDGPKGKRRVAVINEQQRTEGGPTVPRTDPHYVVVQYEGRRAPRAYYRYSNGDKARDAAKVLRRKPGAQSAIVVKGSPPVNRNQYAGADR